MMFGFGWMGWWWPLLGFGFCIGIIILGVWAARFLFPAIGNQRSTEHSSLDTLKHRYAKGEIDGAEFEEARRTLKG